MRILPMVRLTLLVAIHHISAERARLHSGHHGAAAAADPIRCPHCIVKASHGDAIRWQRNVCDFGLAEQILFIDGELEPQIVSRRRIDANVKDKLVLRFAALAELPGVG